MKINKKQYQWIQESLNHIRQEVWEIKEQLKKQEVKMDEKKPKHLAVGKNSNTCEFCGKGNNSDELVSDIEGCEIYAHKKCLERAKMLIDIENWKETQSK